MESSSAFAEDTTGTGTNESESLQQRSGHKSNIKVGICLLCYFTTKPKPRVQCIFVNLMRKAGSNNTECLFDAILFMNFAAVAYLNMWS